MSDEEILRFFVESNDPFLGTSEVAEFLGFSNEGARKRLYALEEEGLLNSKKLGNSPGFWITEAGEEMIES